MNGKKNLTRREDSLFLYVRSFANLATANQRLGRDQFYVRKIPWNKFRGA